MSEKLSERSNMSTAEASVLVRQLAKPFDVGDSVKCCLRRVSRKLPWSFNRVKDVWYADARISISAEEMTQLRRAAKLAAEEQEAKDDLARIDARLSRLESLLQGIDQEFHSETLAALGQSRNRLRGLGDNEKRED